MNLAIFLNYHHSEVTLEQLFMTLCAFSYKGDIRMQFKMENPDKVKNVVQGSLQLLSELYLPVLLQMQAEPNSPISFKDNGGVRMHRSTETLQ
jgi:hypothetical protein